MEAKCPLLHAYKLHDYSVSEWLTEIWQSKENSQFKSLVNQVQVIQRLKSHFTSMYAEQTAIEESKTDERPSDEAFVQMLLQDEEKMAAQQADLNTFAKQLVAELVTDEVSYVTLALFLLTFYVRENCVGPSVYTQYVEETRMPLIKGGPLAENDLDCLSNKNLLLFNSTSRAR